MKKLSLIFSLLALAAVCAFGQNQYYGTFNGNGAGLTSLPATNLVGTVPTNNLPMSQLGGSNNAAFVQSQIAASSTNAPALTVGFANLANTAANWLGTITPTQFGAVGDGATDDTLAISNFFMAFNNGQSLRGELLGKYYYIKQPMPAVTQSNVTIMDGFFITPSTNGPMISFANSFSHLENINLKCTYAGGNPGTNSIGVFLGATGFAVQNNSIVGCAIGGFNVNVALYHTVQTTISLNFLGNCWSNMISIQSTSGGSTSDANNIVANDLNSGDSVSYGFPAPTPYQMTNVVAVQCAGSRALKLSLNNGGGCKQAVYANGANVDVDADNWEQFYCPNTNTVAFQLTNSTVVMNNVTYLNSAGSNYVAVVGLYNCDLADSQFISYTLNSFDVFGYTSYWLIPQFSARNGTVRTHSAFGNTGTVVTYPFGAYASTINPGFWTAGQQWQNGNTQAYLWGANQSGITLSASTAKYCGFYGYRWSDSQPLGFESYLSWGNGHLDFYLGSAEDGGPGATSVYLETAPNDTSTTVRHHTVNATGNLIPVQGTETLGQSGTPYAGLFVAGTVTTNYVLTAGPTLYITNGLIMGIH
jgi:hypothetical protein